MVTEDQKQSNPTMPEKYLPTFIKKVLEELKTMKDIGLPITAINLVGYLRGMVSVVCMGRLGSLELAGGALAVGFTNITGYSILSGLASGMEPLCSQAFGSGNTALASLTLRRTILLLLLVSAPISLLWVSLEPIMVALKQDREVARVASAYCACAVPDLVANSLLHPIRVYFRSKCAPRPVMWCASLALLLHLPITVFLAFHLRLGVPGVAIAGFCTNFNTLALLLCYTLCARNPPNYAPLTSLTPPTAGGEWVSLLRLALPSCAAVCLEWWWYLRNPRVALATSAIVIQTTSLMYTLPATLASSASARVGNELGAGRPARARLAATVAMGLAFLSACLGLMLTTLGKEAWVGVFTKDEEVLELTLAVLPLVGLCELANCPQTTGCGVLRGSARPSIGAVINLCSFYLVGAPVAVVLGFGFGFVGLVLGLFSAQMACVLSVVAVICGTDWEREAMKAKELVGWVEMDAVVKHKCGREEEFFGELGL
ncbi:MATE efflux family protein 9 [Acorus calamus]|uniref:Protein DETOXIFICATION n=1 Tax=Acorus calamus TaxID=4465 RepID=A0AAV9EVW2_ACOCL|nr:MATE efflux family protein 9 [Acorus calamus]